MQKFNGYPGNESPKDDPEKQCDEDCYECEIAGKCDACNLETEPPKPTQIELSGKMVAMKDDFPKHEDGGPSQKQIYQAGLLRFKNDYKYNRVEELLDLLENVFN